MNSRASKHQSQSRRSRSRQAPGSRAWWLIGAVVIAIGAAFLIANTSTDDPTARGGDPSYGREPAPADLVKAVTTIGQDTLDAVGKGSAELPRATGKNNADAVPVVTFIGAEFCPFCAAERWSVVQALARFGTWSDLSITASSATDVYPNTATFSFYESQFTSDYVKFESYEIATNEPNDGGAGYKPLESPSDVARALWQTYSPQGGVPFLSIAGVYVSTAPSFDVALLQGLSYDGIATAMRKSDTDVGRGATGAANAITAAICTVTQNKPATACDHDAIRAIQQQL